MAANPHAQQERAWWDAHTDFECVWGAEGDGVDACLRLVEHGLGPVEPPALMVDLGCGPGRLLVPFAERHTGWEVIGVDVSRRMLDLIPPRPSNCGAALSDGRTIPFPSASLDGVYSVLMFQHVPPAAQHGYLTEIGRVLRLGGRAVVQVILGDRDAERAGSFLDHPVDAEPFLQTAADAGLTLAQQVHRAVLDQWTWLTFERSQPPTPPER